MKFIKGINFLSLAKSDINPGWGNIAKSGVFPESTRMGKVGAKVSIPSYTTSISIPVYSVKGANTCSSFSFQLIKGLTTYQKRNPD
ncbi:MAG: hypothetical protein KPI85_06120 [cyanobacterium endosymbiont of Epithemia adnata isolate EadnSB Bon19]